MRNLMRAVVGLVGLFNIALGMAFLFDPAQAVARFFLTPLGTQGLATVRADFTAFFITGGVFALLGAWREETAPLRVSLSLLGVAIGGRVVSLVLDGAPNTAFPPISVEAGMIAVLLLASRTFAGRAGQ
ncbi:DUF4345 family protein [Sphingomonas echinoides]|uniref:DUF4345 family protein n=1 Tax=Sphingomonas echinoides TaxID=59803 RepID=A0ABU4PKI0_9SPHN|nr:DUF4345 family protein [Sphingomonas echinoides]MDX5983592.1 DUF4345 family protein [Sphingomonas echinoides]